MAFEEAKNIIAKGLDQKDLKTPDDWDYQKDALKRDLDRKKMETSDYIEKLTYPERETDNANYLSEISMALDGILKDKKVEAKEIGDFRVNMNAASNYLIERMTGGQRAFEKKEYENLEVDVDKDVKSAKFDDAQKKLSAFNEKLSPLNKTDTISTMRFRYNLDEPALRLDMVAKQKGIEIHDLQVYYDNILKKGHVVAGREGANYISDKDSSGNVILSETIIDPSTGQVIPSNPQTFNWLELSSEISSKNYQIKKLVIHRDTETGFAYAEPVNINMEVQTDGAIEQDRALLAEIKILKEINYIYTLKGLEDIPEEKREIAKQALKENFDKMFLYFFEHLGKILPTPNYDKASPEEKQQILTQMLEGAQKIINRLELEKNIEQEKDEGKKLFLKGELAMANGQPFLAYSYYRNFLRKGSRVEVDMVSDMRTDAGEETEENLALKQRAAMQLKLASFKLIEFTDQYINSLVPNRTPEEVKKLGENTNQLRQILKQSDVPDLHAALDQWNPDWKNPPRIHGRSLQEGKDYLKAGNVWFGLILIRMAKTSEKGDDKELNNFFLNEARTAREGKTYTASSFLFKQALKPELEKYERLLQQNGAYKSKITEMRDKYFKDLSYFDRLKISVQAGKMAKRSIGGDEVFNKLSKEEQNKLILDFSRMIMDEEIRTKEETFIFENYMKTTKGEKHPAAKEYAVMKNYFDEWKPWKWSDETWDKIKDETIMIAATLPISAGMGTAVFKGLSAGGRAILGKFIAKKTFEKVGTKIALGGMDIAAYFAGMGVGTELFQRAQMALIYGKEGQFEWESLKKGIAHSMITVGAMGLGSKVFAPLLKVLTPYAKATAEELTRFQSFIQRAVPRTISVLGMEAPLISYLGSKMDKESGMTFIQRYLTSLRDMAAIGIGSRGMRSIIGSPPNSVTALDLRNLISEVYGKTGIPPKIKVGLAVLHELGISIKQYIKNPKQLFEFAEYIADNGQLIMQLRNVGETKTGIPKDVKAIGEKFRQGLIKKLQKYGISEKQALEIYNNLGKPKAPPESSLYNEEAVAKSTKESEKVNKEAAKEQATMLFKFFGIDKLQGAEKAAMKKLIRKTYIDEATGMLNRNGKVILDNMIAKGEGNITVVSLDADHFGQNNSCISRQYADNKIKDIAKNVHITIKELKDMGYIVNSIRMGGEEIILYGANVPKAVMKEAMERFRQRTQKETQEGLTESGKAKLTASIWSSKYAKKFKEGEALARSEIGGMSAGIVEINIKHLMAIKGKKTPAELASDLLKYTDRYLEQLKSNQAEGIGGRNQIYADRHNLDRATMEVGAFEAKNSLNYIQNENLARLGLDLKAEARSQFISKFIDRLDPNTSRTTRIIIEFSLRSPDFSVNNLIGRLTAEHMPQAQIKGIVKKYFQSLRDHGTYSGASTLPYLIKPKEMFAKFSVKKIAFGKFKSANETLSHFGGDSYITFMYQKLLLPAAKRFGLDAGKIEIAQKGADFYFKFRDDVSLTTQRKFETYIQKNYKDTVLKFEQQIDSKSGYKWADKRAEWLKDDPAASDQYRLFITIP